MMRMNKADFEPPSSIVIILSEERSFKHFNLSIHMSSWSNLAREQKPWMRISH
jgi:hypothetical protein